MNTLSTHARLMAVLWLAAAPVYAEIAPTPAKIFKTAVADWNMADLQDAAGHNGLSAIGNVTVGIKLEGKDLQDSRACGDDGLMAQFAGGYLNAGQGTDGALNITGPALTVSVRLRNPGGAWGSPIFSKHGGHSHLVYNLYSLGGEIGFELGTQGTEGVSRTTVPVARIGATAWHNVVCRYDGNKLEMFVDGVLMDQTAARGSLREGNTEPCLIGAESYNGQVKTGWQGQIDRVALWNRALSDEEVESLNGGARRIAATRKRWKKAELARPRARLYNEKYRPQFHFSARQWTGARLNPGQRQEGWMNDPNGLIYFDGEYHLFAQRWAKCWIHAVSKDLVHWTELQPAFWEDLRFGEGVQSGGAVVDKDNTSGLAPDAAITPLVAFWAGWDNRNQCVSYSLDKGRTWKEYEKNPVLVHPERDPKVFWYEPDKRWILVLSDGGSYRFFTSKNLLAWTSLNFALPNSFECPDVFQLPVDGDLNYQKWVVVRGNGKYSIGEFDGTKFTLETEQFPCDFGANFYATQSWGGITGRPGRRVQIAWMAGGKYPDMPFNQQMTFPCDLTLHSFPDGLRICRLPIPEIESLYAKTRVWKDKTIQPGQNLLKGIQGELFDIQVQADLAGTKEFGLKCRGAAVTFLSEKKSLSCLGREAPVEAANGKLTLRILIDRASIEIFANDGQVTMSSCFLPDPKSRSLELFCEGGSPRIVSLTVHDLKSAWPKSVGHPLTQAQ